VAAIAGCRRCSATTGCTPDGLGTAVPTGVHRGVADALQALSQPIRLILDDVHELVDPQALHSVQPFLRVKPATGRLVLSSRARSAAPSPVSIAGRLKELRAA
jgi:LuxR family maltose regulon positive regulatory protein